MIVQLLLLTQLIACEDTTEAPPPPPKMVDAAGKEDKKDKKDEKKEDAKAKDGTADAAATMDGTEPKKKKVAGKKIATKQLSEAKCNLLINSAKRFLKAEAKKRGFDGVDDVAVPKSTMKDGKCTGIGQGTPYKMEYTYEAGNAVAVAQADKSKKNAVVKEVKDGKYVVTYADKTESVVEKSALSVQPKK